MMKENQKIARTDLAIELAQPLLEAEKLPEGLKVHTQTHGAVEITCVQIASPKASQQLQKPCGRYITIQTPPLWNSLLDPQQEIDAAADCIRSLLPQEGTVELGEMLAAAETREGAVLVVGLGNSSITPDALGPQVAQHILVTRHLTEELARSLGMGSLRKTAALIPGVLGQTGVESGELTAALVNFIQPSAVIVVDALAAQDYGRLGRTIQISDSGIAPGSGVQNSRKELSRRTLGIPVLSIGVPTVIDAATLAAQLTGSSCEQAHQTAMVTPREIDRLIGHSAKFIALAINKALYPELSLEEIGFLCA